MKKSKTTVVKKKIGRPTTYKPEYAKMIVEFFSPPYYLIKDMTITRPDGTQIDNTKMEALPPLFLSDFARSIGVSNIHYRQIFSDWAKKNKDYSDALKEAKSLEVERYRVNGSLHLYNPAFAIFTLKNIAGWRDSPVIDQSKHTHFEFKYNIINEDRIRVAQSANGSVGIASKVEGISGGEKVRKNIACSPRIDAKGIKP